MTAKLALNMGALRALYRSGEAHPSDVVAMLYERIRSAPLAPVWISLVPREAALARARALERDPLAPARPLYGVPFALKDNIDLAELPTSAGCPGFAYSPSRNATVVEALVDAGAIPIGKTNLDQFATGLVGTRSPYGACSSVFDNRYISGGSSSGSAVAVAAGLVTFALGTDTAGSGRVPAAFNSLVGLKPTRGLLSTLGVVCRTLDCVSILAGTAHDAHTVWQVARGFDAEDPFSRVPRPGQSAAAWLGGSFRFGVSAAEQCEFFGDIEASGLYQKALDELQRLGGERVEIDFAPFRAAADLLYSGPWVAERLAAIGPFLDAHPEQVNPVVREIICSGRRYTAVQTFEAEYRLRELRRQTEAQWALIDVLALPTTGTIYTHEQVAADPIRLNANLGYYTNFVNLLDLAATAVPAGFRSTGLPFGLSLIGPAFSDEALLGAGGPVLSGANGTCRPGSRERHGTAGLYRGGGGGRAPDRPAVELATHRTRRASHEDLPDRAMLPPVRAGKDRAIETGAGPRRWFCGSRNRSGSLGGSRGSVRRFCRSDPFTARNRKRHA
jgi:allophanate hydrolase